MKRFLIAITLLVFITTLTADAQWRNKTHDVYNALQLTETIEIDGELNDEEGWEAAFETVTGTDGKMYCGLEFETNGGGSDVWESWQAGTWDGPDDQETCFAIFWEPDAVYIGISVTDDEHEHAAAAVHAGDSTQLSFIPSGEREEGQQNILYNIALDDTAKAILLLNETIHGNEAIVAGEDVAIVRNEDEKETYYEIRITPENLGLKDPFSEGYEFGLGICVNDGDKAAGQGGQKGWSGWYPHAVVHGKNPSKTGLVILSDETLAVEPVNKLTTTWGNLKSLK